MAKTKFVTVSTTLFHGFIMEFSGVNTPAEFHDARYVIPGGNTLPAGWTEPELVTVPRDFAEAWLARNAQWGPVVNGLIIIADPAKAAPSPDAAPTEVDAPTETAPAPDVKAPKGG